MDPWSVYDNIVTDNTSLSALNLNSGFCTYNSQNIVINTMESSDEKSSLILVLPTKYKNIKYTENASREPVTVSEKWKQQTDGNGNPLQFTYRNGTANTTYYVYILHSLMAVKYYNIKFGV